MARPSDPSASLPSPPAQLVDRLRDHEFVIASVDAAGGGVMGPKKLRLVFPKDGVFSIDNGIAFGGLLYNFFTWHFDAIRTAGLPRVSIDRRRGVSRETLSGHGVLGELRADPAGVLRAVTRSENLEPAAGTRVAPGRIQFGLTVEEIDAIATRLQELLARIDAGGLAVF
jgi:hypothetical protein